VTVNGYHAINEHFIKDAETYRYFLTYLNVQTFFSGRFASDEFYELTRGGKVSGIIGTEGEVWREHRRFALQVFR
jgi:hypothetical protein